MQDLLTALVSAFLVCLMLLLLLKSSLGFCKRSLKFVWSWGIYSLLSEGSMRRIRCIDAAHRLNFAWGPRLIYSGIFVHRLQMRRNLFFVCGACSLSVLDCIWWNLDSDTPCVRSVCGVSGVEQAWSSSLTKVSYATHVRMACGAFFKVRQWSSNSSKYDIASYLLSEIRRIFWISVDFWHLARFAP